ncbi:MAG: AAA family ATPase [Clostridia bacterium]|nr:AAA family ATPase [Clostridia bacterium]
MLENQSFATTMTVAQMVRQLSFAYTTLIKNKLPLKRFPSVMLWGQPGVGKSQGVKQIAEEMSVATGKKVVITDVRLLLFNPVDLRGIPTANADKTLAVWLKPQIFQMDDSEDVINILFLDEISAAPQSVQASAYQITLDRTVGEHKLPENCIVIAAGNRVTDKSVVYTMPKALANRLCHIEIKSNATAWYEWAVKNGINEKVCGYIKNTPDVLNAFNTEENSLAFPTPRSWEMVSNILNDVSSDINSVFPLIAGCVGEEAAYDFKNWCEIYSKIPSAKDVFVKGKCIVPGRPEALMATATMITSNVKKHSSAQEIYNAIDFVDKMPLEFRTNIFEEFLKIKNIRKILESNKIYNDWFMRSGRFWEDYD